MRRSLLAVAVVAAVVGWLPSPASADHRCAEEFEVVCFATCPRPPKICPLP